MLVITHSLVLACVGPNGHVREILECGGEPQIGPPIVEPIAVDVVDQHRAGCLQEKAMHIRGAHAPRVRDHPAPGIMSPGGSVRLKGVPLERKKECDIGVINEGGLTLGKLEFFHASLPET